MKFSNPPTNAEIAEYLQRIAAALKVKKANNFRINSYQKASESIKHSSSTIKDLWKEHKLSKLPGVGKNIASYIDDIFRTGKSQHLDKEIKGLPLGMFPLLKIPGIGPKTAYRLALKLGLTHEHSAITKLEKAAKQGEIKQIQGFKEDSEKKFLDGINELKKHSNRILIHHADKTSNQIIKYLNQNPAVQKAIPLGSLRRKSPTIGDIDIGVATNQKNKVLKHFIQYPFKNRVLEVGDISATIILNDQTHVDLLVQSAQNFGSLMQHFTGSKNHNIHLRQIALKKGWSLSENGLKRNYTNKNTKAKTQIKTFNTEKKLYNFLGLQYIEPELRQDNGEIQKAQNNELPNLIKPNDIKGDFHIHSNYPIEPSHDLGLNSMIEMVNQAIKFNYQYIAFSEHNPSMSEHSNRQIIDIIKRKQETIFRLNEKYEKEMKNVKILNSLEIDIKPNGKLAIPSKAFDFLDIAIVSIHSSFKQTKKMATQRILTALQAHPKIKIWGHPTGRIINQRTGLEFEWEKIFDYCINSQKWIEIDGWPNRLDLPDSLVKEAIKAGVNLTIDSDAHQIDHMRMIKYGVSVARRGWAESKNVINTLPWSKLQKILP